MRGNPARARRILAFVGLLTALTAGAASSAGASPTSSAAAPPPPAVDWNTIQPGTWTLIAVLPPGAAAWVKPGVGAGSAYSAGRPGMVNVSSSSGAVTPALESFGCDAYVDTPYFSGSELMGRVAWDSCFNVSEVSDTVGLQKQGAPAAFFKTTTEYGGYNFTAYSWPVTNCVFVNHQWRTEDTAEIYSTDGQSSFWAGSSAYVARYC